MYEATQKQRQIERTIRKQKRLETAYKSAGLDEDYTSAKTRRRRLEEKYKEFSKAAGLPEQRDRMKVYVAKDKALISAESAYTPLKTIQTNRPIEHITDVTQEYLDNAMPNKGKLFFELGYKTGHHQNEIEAANWIKDNFGGDITLLKETEINGARRADYIWKNKYWELKSASSPGNASKYVKHGMTQIKDNPGGIVLKIKKEVDYSKLKRELAKSVLGGDINCMDIITINRWGVLFYKI